MGSSGLTLGILPFRSVAGEDDLEIARDAVVAGSVPEAAGASHCTWRLDWPRSPSPKLASPGPAAAALPVLPLTPTPPPLLTLLLTLPPNGCGEFVAFAETPDTDDFAGVWGALPAALNAFSSNALMRTPMISTSPETVDGIG